MMCAERLPQYCHRALIADYLTAQGSGVVHLIDEVTAVPHRLNGMARECDGHLIYDRGVDLQLGLDW